MRFLLITFALLALVLNVMAGQGKWLGKKGGERERRVDGMAREASANSRPDLQRGRNASAFSSTHRAFSIV